MLDDSLRGRINARLFRSRRHLYIISATFAVALMQAWSTAFALSAGDTGAALWHGFMTVLLAGLAVWDFHLENSVNTVTGKPLRSFDDRVNEYLDFADLLSMDFSHAQAVRLHRAAHRLAALGVLKRSVGLVVPFTAVNALFGVVTVPAAAALVALAATAWLACWIPLILMVKEYPDMVSFSKAVSAYRKGA